MILEWRTRTVGGVPTVDIRITRESDDVWCVSEVQNATDNWVARLSVTGTSTSIVSVGALIAYDLTNETVTLTYSNVPRRFISQIQGRTGGLTGDFRVLLTFNPRVERPTAGGSYETMPFPSGTFFHVSTHCPDPPTTRPTAGIQISRGLAYQGQQHTVSWTSSNATSAIVEFRLSTNNPWTAHSTALNGSVTYTVGPPATWPLGPRYWRISATNSAGTTTSSATIQIVAAPVEDSTDSNWSGLFSIPSPVEASTDSNWSSLTRLTPFDEPSTDGEWSSLARMTAFAELSTDSEWSSLEEMASFETPTTDSQWSSLASMDEFTDPDPPPASVSISASQTRPQLNESVTISWTSENARNVRIFNENTVIFTGATSGSLNTPAYSSAQTRTFSITADGGLRDEVDVSWSDTGPCVVNYLLDLIINGVVSPNNSFLIDTWAGEVPAGRTLRDGVTRYDRQGQADDAVIAQALADNPRFDAARISQRIYGDTNGEGCLVPLLPSIELRLEPFSITNTNPIPRIGNNFYPQVGLDVEWFYIFRYSAYTTVRSPRIGQTTPYFTNIERGEQHLLGIEYVRPETEYRGNTFNVSGETFLLHTAVTSSYLGIVVAEFGIYWSDDSIDSEWSTLERMTPDPGTDSEWSTLERMTPDPGTDSEWSTLERMTPDPGTDSEWSTLERMTPDPGTDSEWSDPRARQ